ncbi:hypothetical protein ACETU7_23490 [Rhodococcus sp. 3Y1]
MIGAGIGNLSAAVYLIRDGEGAVRTSPSWGWTCMERTTANLPLPSSTSTVIASWATTRASSIVAVACSTRRPMRTSGTC